jgi:protein TonB
LTSEPTPDDGPVDLTGWGIVTGESERYAGGVTTSKGTSKTAVRERGGIQGGVPGGTGTAPAPPPKPTQDLSKPPGLTEGSWNNCGFPPEADMEQINYATVSIAVTVGADGSPKSVNVLKDPGHGFGRLARQCAMRKRYRAGLDASGTAVVKTVQFSVRFTR